MVSRNLIWTESSRPPLLQWGLNGSDSSLQVCVFPCVLGVDQRPANGFPDEPQ